MIHADIINDLLKCIEKADYQFSIFPCCENKVEQETCLSDGSQPLKLNRRQIIRIKTIIKKTAKREKYDLEKIFLKLWWSRQLVLNRIAAHLMPEVYSENTTTDIENIKTLLWRIDNRIVCNELSFSLSKLVPHQVEIWKETFKEWAVSDFKWNRLIGILLITRTAKMLTLQIPELLKIVALYMQETNTDIQEEVSVSLRLMAEQWDLPVIHFIDKYQYSQNPNTKQILKKCNL
ncbi:MAG TPA: hypothetical protein ENK44_09935 [Caldithrix abyssi]|uniref:DNA alkylation repair protein n=1 Tax=Caldithrix abyssi TaxID=187145 RepID=A0A7V4WVY9_CALAY|nr:hypothetical protein [Caldithrix abyssi]